MAGARHRKRKRFCNFDQRNDAGVVRNDRRAIGKVANVAKTEYEKTTGQEVISPLNAKNKKLLETKRKDN